MALSGWISCRLASRSSLHDHKWGTCSQHRDFKLDWHQKAHISLKQKRLRLLSVSFFQANMSSSNCFLLLPICGFAASLFALSSLFSLAFSSSQISIPVTVWTQLTCTWIVTLLHLSKCFQSISLRTSLLFSLGTWRSGPSSRGCWCKVWSCRGLASSLQLGE